MHRYLLIAAAMLVPACASAADYTLDGSLRYDTSHDNNQQLSEQRQSAWGQTASADVALGAETEQSTANLETQLWARRFNRQGFDSDDQTVRAQLSHLFERSSVSLGLSAVRDSTLTSELLDSGRVTNSQRHEQYLASPSWSFQVGEKDLLSLQGSYMDSQYHGDGYTDYRYWQTQLLWTHTLTERLRGFASISYSNYASQPIQYSFDQSYATNSTDKGFQLGGDYQFSEAFTASLMGGLSRNHTAPKIEDPQQFCPLARANPFLLSILPLCALDDTYASLTTLNGSLSWKNPRNELSLDISRATQPSSNGYVQQTEQLNLNWRYHLWEYGVMGVVITAGTTDAPDERSARSNTLSRDYQYATLSYTHSLNEEWLFDCNYQYRTQQYDQRDRVESNVAFVGITWKPKTQHWSR